MAMEHLSVANETEGLNLKFHFNQLEFEYKTMCHFICSAIVVLACVAHYEVNWLSWYNKVLSSAQALCKYRAHRNHMLGA